MTRQEIKDWAAETVHKIFHGHNAQNEHNKKLRLLITGKCPNKCPMCCNNRFDLEKIPVVEGFDQYDEINITGGEPMLFPYDLYDIISDIRHIEQYTGKHKRVYLYTSKMPKDDILDLVDGICYTPHSKKDAEDFIRERERVESMSISLRLNVFPEVENYLPKDSELPQWKVKHMQWIKDCPVPQGEDFRRINTLLI